jgi:hypothetical protein
MHGRPGKALADSYRTFVCLGSSRTRIQYQRKGCQWVYRYARRRKERPHGCVYYAWPCELSTTIRACFTETLKFLVAKGADHTLVTFKGRTTLDCAKYNADRQGQREIIGYIKKLGELLPRSWWTSAHEYTLLRTDIVVNAHYNRAFFSLQNVGKWAGNNLIMKQWQSHWISIMHLIMKLIITYNTHCFSHINRDILPPMLQIF